MKEVIYERIVSEINPDVENPQLSERSIRETLDAIVPEDISEDGVDAFIESKMPLFVTMAGNVRKDVADFVKKAKPKPEPAVVDDPTDEDPPKKPVEGGEENPLSAIMSEIAKLNKRFDEREGQVVVEKSKAELQNDAHKLYPENVVRVASMDFDFSVDNAKDVFFNKLSDVAKEFNVKPEGGKPDNDFKSEDFLKRNRERFKHS